MAQLLSSSKENLSTAARALANGHLVAFPTETVYGLGANALDPEAVQRIFLAKGRPLTDPLIVHTATATQAHALAQLTTLEERLFWRLAEAFWPGPLTLVVPAKRPPVPEAVTAGGPSVGLRVPQHPVALALLQAYGGPVAAPSANRFGHVSPTSAAHVEFDLGAVDNLWIIDGGPCTVGIESTVVKMVSAHCLRILRRGAISRAQILQLLPEREFGTVDVEVVERRHTSKQIAQEAPGQLLTHYAPLVPAFLLRLDEKSNVTEMESFVTLSEAVVVDCGARLLPLQGRCLAYRDVAPTGELRQAAEEIFAGLRWAEGVSGAKAVLLPNLQDCENELGLAVFDRLFRAASGRAAQIKAGSDQVYVSAR